MAMTPEEFAAGAKQSLAMTNILLLLILIAVTGHSHLIIGAIGTAFGVTALVILAALPFFICKAAKESWDKSRAIRQQLRLDRENGQRLMVEQALQRAERDALHQRTTAFLTTLNFRQGTSTYGI